MGVGEAVITISSDVLQETCQRQVRALKNELPRTADLPRFRGPATAGACRSRPHHNHGFVLPYRSCGRMIAATMAWHWVGWPERRPPTTRNAGPTARTGVARGGLWRKPLGERDVVRSQGTWWCPGGAQAGGMETGGWRTFPDEVSQDVEDLRGVGDHGDDFHGLVTTRATQGAPAVRVAVRVIEQSIFRQRDRSECKHRRAHRLHLRQRQLGDGGMVQALPRSPLPPTGRRRALGITTQSSRTRSSRTWARGEMVSISSGRRVPPDTVTSFPSRSPTALGFAPGQGANIPRPIALHLTWSTI